MSPKHRWMDGWMDISAEQTDSALNFSFISLPVSAVQKKNRLCVLSVLPPSSMPTSMYFPSVSPFPSSQTTQSQSPISPKHSLIQQPHPSPPDCDSYSWPPAPSAPPAPPSPWAAVAQTQNLHRSSDLATSSDAPRRWPRAPRRAWGIR